MRWTLRRDVRRNRAWVILRSPCKSPHLRWRCSSCNIPAKDRRVSGSERSGHFPASMSTAAPHSSDVCSRESAQWCRFRRCSAHSRAGRTRPRHCQVRCRALKRVLRRQARSVEQLAARLHARWRSSTRRLAEQLEKANRTINAQMNGRFSSNRRAFETTERRPAACVSDRPDATTIPRGRTSPLPDDDRLLDARHSRAGLHRGAFFPGHARAGIPGLEHVQRQQVAAEGHLEQWLPVPDRGRGIWASIPPRVSDRCTDLGPARPGPGK